MELNNIQKEIVKTNEHKVLVNSAAASGKTALIVERIRYLLSNNVPADKIVAITFTNNAANEMLERLGYPDGLFIGTVHSYSNYLLRCCSIDTSQYLNEERFDELFELVKQNPYCIQPVEHLIVDEAQDSTDPQFDFFEMINPKNYMYCYDLRQSIFGFTGARPQRIANKELESGVKVYSMDLNYRNGYNILSFAQNLLYNLDDTFQDTSVAVNPKDGFVKHTHWSFQDITDYFLYDVKEKDYNKWFILCRSNEQIAILMEKFKENGLPCVTFKQAQLTNKEIDKLLNSNVIKILTIHSAKGLESEKVLVLNVYYENDEDRFLYYVAATRAKNLLIWNKLKKFKKKKKNIEKNIKTINWE